MRWLWPEALRVLSEVRPRWAVFENPPGINDVGLDGILADVEGKGYEVAPPFIIPACAVGAPHRRERYWIVAHHTGSGQLRTQEHKNGKPNCERGRGHDVADNYTGNLAHASQPGRGSVWKSKEGDELFDTSCESDLADTEEIGGRTGLRDPGQTGERGIQLADSGFWSNSIWLPCADGKVRRAPDYSFGLVDGLHRSVLGALGNSIVPQVAGQIIKAIVMAENTEDSNE